MTKDNFLKQIGLSEELFLAQNSGATFTATGINLNCGAQNCESDHYVSFEDYIKGERPQPGIMGIIIEGNGVTTLRGESVLAIISSFLSRKGPFG